MTTASEVSIPGPPRSAQILLREINLTAENEFTMTKRFTLLMFGFLALIFLLPPVSRSQDTKKITEANWQQHPEIRAIRRIVRSVDASLKQGNYKIARREFEVCPNQYFTVRRIARDSKGVVAWYEDYFEYEDGSYNFHYYYDHVGRLRFILAFARAANGTREELRIYFDETGKRLWKIDKLLKGWGCPGCFSGYSDSDEGLAFDPAKAFANDEGCKEIKPKPGRRAR